MCVSFICITLALANQGSILQGYRGQTPPSEHGGQAHNSQSQGYSGATHTNSKQAAFRVCLGGGVESGEAKGSSKMAAGATNQNYCFDCKWQSPIEATILIKPFQPIRVILLIASGGPPYEGRHFRGRTSFIHSREAVQISP